MENKKQVNKRMGKKENLIGNNSDGDPQTLPLHFLILSMIEVFKSSEMFALVFWVVGYFTTT